MPDKDGLVTLTCRSCGDRIAVIHGARAWCACGGEMVSAKAATNAASNRKCGGCGKEFAPATNRQKLCPVCSKVNERRNAAGRMQKMRSAKPG